MNKLLKIGLLVVGCSVGPLVHAQTTQVLQDPDAEFKSAKELYQKEQFSLAYPVFKKIYSNGIGKTNLPMSVQLEAQYYYIICGLQLNDETAEPMAVAFSELEHDVPHVQMMNYHLAEYYYRTKNLGKAQEYYQQANIANLSNSEIANMKFHQGYAYFSMQQFDKAKPLFNAIRQLPKDPNYVDANYYYGFIVFSEKNYSQALECFRIAQQSPAYQNIVPFYIAEIYYFNGERDKALEYGEQMLSKPGQYYDLQLRQLVGHILFEKKQYARALPYLEQYVSKKDKVRREDLYELSYCYYEAGNWPKSIDGFKQLGGGEDSLAQNSMYLLGDAYLKTNDKPNARNAFLFCASNNSNAAQKEVSQFNYAKLSYDLGYMDAALKGFRSFLTDHPQSKFSQEAKELLVSTLANTSNYKDALSLYESLTGQSENTVKLYPRLLYGRSVELINDQQITKADELLTRIIQSPYNNQQLPYTYFWKGEIAYRKGDPDAAIGFLSNYLRNPLVNGEVNPTNARYSLAYSELKTENYEAARGHFEQVAGSYVSSASSAIEQDAYLRAADCYFMTRNYKQALRMYEQVLSQRLPGADYALLQKAVIAGASSKNTEKVGLLQSLERQFPGSAYTAEANMEIANTYMADENFQAALAPLKLVLDNNKATSLHPQAYLKMGIAYFNLDKNAESLEQFKKLVAYYPNTQESSDAVEYIRSIFVANQKPGDFVAFMRQQGKPVTYNEEDSLTFRSAMMRYDAKDVAEAKAGFADYLSKFPDGRYNIEVNYFTAELYIAAKDYNKALPYYTAVAAKGQSQYAERSLLQAARIYYFDLKDYASAEKYFTQLKELARQQENKLEAMRGLLRCQFKAQKWKEAAPNAQELLQEKGIATDDRMMANMVVAKNHQLNNEPDLALAAYKQVVAAGKSEWSAEAQYRSAEILFAENKLPEAEKGAFEVIKKLGSYEYWVAKSYILLGDIYTKEKDWFNAEATFKSIVENATITELKTEAQQKLIQVQQEKNKVNKVEQP